VPEAETELAFILTTMAGHLFGYHAAMAIDALARPLREARGVIEIGALAPNGGDMRERLRPGLQEPFRRFRDEMSGGRYNGVLEARTASRLALLFRYAMRALPLEFFTVSTIAGASSRSSPSTVSQPTATTSLFSASSFFSASRRASLLPLNPSAR